jgi:outer membrane cobalamin receptor
MTLQRALVYSFALAAAIAPLYGAELKGTVVDPSQRPITGATVAAFNGVGIIVEQITDDQGGFDFNVSPLYETYQLRITAPGFQTVTVAASASQIQLALGPQSDSVNVVASAIDVPASQQGSGESVITSGEIRDRNEAQMVDLMRELPGVTFAQSGPRGSVVDLFVRGGSSNYNLVLLDGIPINSFYYGGLFDFSQIPSDFISEIDVARGPQSAIYGSYAIGSVVNLTTRSPANGPSLDVVGEGGSHDENRASVSGSDMIHGWGIAGSGSSLLTNGPVQNSDYRLDDVFLSAQHRWYTQNLFAFGDFDSNDAGEPGPFGSNPKGIYTGIDRISRSRNNTSTYGIHYTNDLTDKVRLDVLTGFFLNNSLYISPYGDSFNKDIRAYGEARATWKATSFWTLAGGFTFDREELKNTYVATTNGYIFPFRRDHEGIYIENRFVFLRKIFINAGLREDVYMTPFIPGDAYNFPPRPNFAARTDSRVDPKISGVYLLQPTVSLHASYGTGIRPPGGSDLAFTNNPALAPERTYSYDVGVEERFWSNQLSLDATWFHNRYKDLIVSLGGSLSEISQYHTGNLANSMAEGVETTGRFRPKTWFSITANYMWLESAVLSLTGSGALVQQYYYLGQPLLRRPKQSGSAVVNLEHGKFAVNLVGYFRGHDLDVEPNYGLSEGQYRAPGYVSTGVNINYRIRGNLTLYANLRNALDRRYEEIFGYPAPLLNIVAGFKWSLARAR